MYHYPVDFLDYCEKMNLRGKHNDCQWIILIKMVLKWIKKPRSRYDYTMQLLYLD